MFVLPFPGCSGLSLYFEIKVKLSSQRDNPTVVLKPQRKG